MSTKQNDINAEQYKESLEEQLEKGLLTQDEYERLLGEYPDEKDEAWAEDAERSKTEVFETTRGV